MNRRKFLKLSLMTSAPVMFALGGGLLRGETARSAPAGPAALSSAQGMTLAPTPQCVDDDDVTPPQTEGPYYTRNSPERTTLLEPGMAGTRIVLTGSVVDTACRPIPRALVDFWQADDGGAYDNVGYRLRGHQFTDDAGRYSLETVVPGLYPGRTRHFHVKVQAPNQPVLTTQLYFPDEPRNARDGIFSPELLLAVQDAPDGSKLAGFDFVLDLG
jgi:protocatechuate 3,4-dioxygenase beta subunit